MHDDSRIGTLRSRDCNFVGIAYFQPGIQSRNLFKFREVIVATARFIGVYASRTATANRTVSGTPGGTRKSYWFVWEDDLGQYRVQLLDAAFQPVGAPRPVTGNEFREKFTHQPHILVTPVRRTNVDDAEEEKRQTVPPSAAGEKPEPALWGLAANRPETVTLDEPVQPAEKPAAASAEALAAAERLDREFRAEFAVALTKWKRGENRSSLKTFEAMADRSEGVVAAHKHMFTDFAVDLRKSRLPTLAKKHYLRAVELGPEDCNAHFNMARICYETGDPARALEHLNKALELEPDFEYARRFKSFLEDADRTSRSFQSGHSDAGVSRIR